MSTPSLETDLLVVGGGPAGLAASIAARMKNLRVIVAEHSSSPLDKACGEGLMPDGVEALRKLGIEPEALQSHSFRGIRFINSDASFEAKFPNRSGGIGLRRTTLNEALVRRAADLGVKLFWGSRVREAQGRSARIGVTRVSYRWLILANGFHSATLSRFVDVRKQDLRYGFRRHYRCRPWTDFVEVYWGKGHQIYVAPVSAHEVCVALLSRNPSERIDAVLPEFPNLAERLRGAQATETRDRGALTGSRVLRSVVSENSVLIGDASGSVDALTGQGLYLAFQQALDLADALASDELAAYAGRHRALMKRPLTMSRLMVSIGDRHVLRDFARRAITLHPSFFGALLALHLGENPLRLAGARAG